MLGALFFWIFCTAIPLSICNLCTLSALSIWNLCTLITLSVWNLCRIFVRVVRAFLASVWNLVVPRP
jgi:hypothetical protein